MDEREKTQLTRSILNGAAIFGAAMLAFTFNQGGLTGRATGGPVGCGGGAPPRVDGASKALAVADDSTNDGARLEAYIVLIPQGTSYEVGEMPGPMVAEGGNVIVDGNLLEGVQPLAPKGKVYEVDEMPMPMVGEAGPELIHGQIEEGAQPLNTTGTIPGLDPTRMPTIIESGKIIVDGNLQTGYQPLQEDPIVVERPGTLLARLELDGHTRFIDLIAAARMTHVFSDLEAEFTVFAPTNEAIEAWPRLVDFERPENRPFLMATIQQHMIPGKMDLAELGDNPMTEVPKQPLMIDFGSNVVMTMSGQHKGLIVRPDRETDRGMVHAIDGVLQPQMTLQIMTLRAGYNLFYAAMQEVGVIDEVVDPERPMSLLAVSDANMRKGGLDLDAIRLGKNQAVIYAMLRNHIVEGAYPTFRDVASPAETLSGHTVVAEVDSELLHFSFGESCTVLQRLLAENGVIHEVDGALLGHLDITR